MESNYNDRYKHVFAALKKGNYKEAKEISSKLTGNMPPSFVAFLDNIISNRGLNRKCIIIKADIEQQYGYRLLSGAKHTNNRNYILRLCMAMDMTVEEMQTALALYGLPTLSYTNHRDSIILIAYAQHHGMDTIDEWLVALGLDGLRQCG